MKNLKRTVLQPARTLKSIPGFLWAHSSTYRISRDDYTPLVEKPQKSILAQTIGSPRIFSMLPVEKPRKRILTQTIGSPRIFSMLLAQCVHDQPVAKPQKSIRAQTIGSRKIFYMLICTIYPHSIILILITASFWCISSSYDHPDHHHSRNWSIIPMLTTQCLHP